MSEARIIRWGSIAPVLVLATLSPKLASAQTITVSPDPAEPAVTEAAPCIEDADDEDADDEVPEYGDQGVVELGGDIDVFWADPTLTLAASPSVGVFVIDYFELTASVDLVYVSTEDPDTGDRTDSTGIIALIEPSYHLPLDDDLYLLTGLGVGVGYDGVVTGFELVPRVGLNIGITRTGLLTPAVRVPITLGVVEEGEDERFEAEVAVGLEVGYTTIW